jgi:hypothetical protein
VDDQIKELTKQVMDLRLDLARMDTKMDSIKDMQHKVDDHGTRITAVESSAAQAHHRLNRMDKITTGLILSFGGALLAAIAGFIIKGGLVK